MQQSSIIVSVNYMNSRMKTLLTAASTVAALILGTFNPLSIEADDDQCRSNNTTCSKSPTSSILSKSNTKTNKKTSYGTPSTSDRNNDPRQFVTTHFILPFP
jgi:hypothetical protein